MGVQQNRRRSERIQPFVAPCRYVIGEARVPGFLTDISRHGGRVHTDADPPADGVSLTVELRVSRQPYIPVRPNFCWAMPMTARPRSMVSRNFAFLVPRL